MQSNWIECIVCVYSNFNWFSFGMLSYAFWFDLKIISSIHSAVLYVASDFLFASTSRLVSWLCGSNHAHGTIIIIVYWRFAFCNTRTPFQTLNCYYNWHTENSNEAECMNMRSEWGDGSKSKKLRWKRGKEIEGEERTRAQTVLRLFTNNNDKLWDGKLEK